MADVTASQTSLYELLAEPAWESVEAGETSLTATKETLDADTEDVVDDDVIHGRSG